MDPTLIVMVVLLGGMMFFMFRSNKKRQNEAQKLRDKAAVGAKVMTNFGLFGTIIDIDEDEDIVSIESTPGTVVRVHRQTIARVDSPEEPENVAEDAEASVTSGSAELDDGTHAKYDTGSDAKFVTGGEAEAAEPDLGKTTDK